MWRVWVRGKHGGVGHPRRGLWRWIVWGLGWGILSMALKAPGAPAVAPASLVEIAPGVHVRPGHHGELFRDAAVANVGFIVGERCVAVVDTGGSPAEGRALAAAVAETTAIPICYVIFTHHHPDHVLGGSAFRLPGVTFVGHARLGQALAITGAIYLRRLAEASGETAQTQWLVAPDVTLPPGATMVLDLGGRTLEVQAYPPAHTNNDLSVWDDATDTWWLGDLLFVHRVPAIDASARGWLQVLDALRAREPARGVPGHGPVAVPWPEASDDLIRYLTTLRREARRVLAAGSTLGEAQGVVGRGEASRWQLFTTAHARNIARVYTELEWEEP